VEKLIRAEIWILLQRKVKDPRVHDITITEVDVSPDLKNARILFSLLGDEAAQEEALAGLESAAGYMRSELMKVLDLRPMPILVFEFDESFHRTEETLDTLDRVLHEDEQRYRKPTADHPSDPAE
jgi:ribosome-binding factor A